jgi:hypothetical protein
VLLLRRGGFDVERRLALDRRDVILHVELRLCRRWREDDDSVADGRGEVSKAEVGHRGQNLVLALGLHLLLVGDDFADAWTGSLRGCGRLENRSVVRHRVRGEVRLGHDFVRLWNINALRRSVDELLGFRELNRGFFVFVIDYMYNIRTARELVLVLSDGKDEVGIAGYKGVHAVQKGRRGRGVDEGCVVVRVDSVLIYSLRLLVVSIEEYARRCGQQLHVLSIVNGRSDDFRHIFGLYAVLNERSSRRLQEPDLRLYVEISSMGSSIVNIRH